MITSRDKPKMKVKTDHSCNSEEKPGFKHTKLGWIPEEWQHLTMDKACLKIQDGTHFSPKPQTYGDYKYITSKNVRMGKLDQSNVQFISKEEHKLIYSRCDVQFGDLLLTKDGASTGNICMNNLHEEFSLLSSVALLRVDSKLTDNSFLYHLLASSRGQYIIKDAMAGQAITRITLSTLKSFSFYFPPLPEQQKIAQILSTWDKAIAKMEQLILKKQERKRGLMQQLLTGKKRFKEFVKSDKMKETKLGLIPEDWEVKKVSDVFEFISTNSFSRSQMHYNHVENGTFNIHYGDIHATYKEPILDFETENSVPSLIETFKPISTKTYLQEGDVIIADASEDHDGIGEAVELKNVNERKVLAGLHTFALRDVSSFTSVGFRAYIFKNPKVSKAIKVIATGSKVYGISKANLARFELVLPPIEEQSKIASVLVKADKEISALQYQLDQVKNQKKGLMQKLLTGEVRTVSKSIPAS